MSEDSDDLTWREVLDSVWLADRINRISPTSSPTAFTGFGEGEDSPLGEPDGLTPDQADLLGGAPPGLDPDSDPGPGVEVIDLESGEVAAVAPGPRSALGEAGELEEIEGAGHDDRELSLVPHRSRSSGPTHRDHDFALIARALRPFKTSVPALDRTVLDESATADSVAEDPFWLPVFQPDTDRAWDAVLVADQHGTMDAARPIVEQFRLTLERQGFRNVHLRLLETADPAKVTLTSAGRQAAARRPADVVLPGARRIIFVLTDGAAPAWHSGAALRALAEWGRRHPVAAVHLLPETRWRLTGLRGRPVSLQAAEPGSANSRWRYRARDLVGLLADRQPADQPGADHPGTARRGPLIAVPVLELHHRWLGAWARLVTRSTSEWVDLAAALVHPGAVAVQLPDPTPASAAEQVARFRSSVAPSTFQLATYLAAAPLDLHLMRTIQERLLPDSTPGQLSEILASPLIRPRNRVQKAAGSIAIRFEFPEGVREELLASGRNVDIVKVARTVDDALGSGRRHLHLSTILASPEGTPARRISPNTLPWQRVEVAVLSALSGRYLKRARRTDRDIVAWEQAHPEPDSGRRANVLPGASPARRSSGEPESTGDGRAPREPEAAAGAPPETSTAHTSAEGQEVSSTLDDELTVSTDETLRSRLRRGPSIAGNLPLRNANFTGREELLQQLHERLHGDGVTAVVLPHALHGMGGVGKTHLAVEYIYRHLDDYDLVWWIPAERTARIAASLVELARRLGLHAGEEANTAVPVVLEALRLGEPAANWLLVFDNAERPDLVREYLPHGGPGNILITSRDPRWAEVAEPLEVNVFRREESVHLLQRRGKDLSDRDADRMAEALGDLPLALDQAAAWYVETGMPADEYLRLFNEKRAELLDQASFEDQTPVIAAWNVSLDRLENSDTAALQLLQVCSYFAADQIPRTLLTGARNHDTAPELDKALDDPIRFGRALREISKYSLARIDHRTNSIQMHRLVQAALIARMSEDQQAMMKHAAHVILAANDPNDPESPAQFARYGELYPHLIASQTVDCQDRWARALIVNECKYLYRWGDHHAARRLGQQALAAWRESLGPEDPQTLEMAKYLGFVLFAVGRYQAAAELNAGTLATYQELKARGEGDRDGELEALRNVAIDRLAQGEFSDARTLATQVLDGSIAAFGEDDPATLNAAHNLAVALRQCGDFTGARDLDTETWDRKQQIFGSDHPLTVLTRLGLLVDIRELGDYRMALGMSQDALALCQTAFGEINPVTLLARRMVAVAQRKAGQHVPARTTSELVASQLIQRYTEDHPEAMAANSNLSIDLRQTGDLVAARGLGARTQALYRQNLGPEHPHTLSADVNLAITHRLLGDLTKARDLDSAALAVFTRRLGPDHPSTLVSATSLASDFYLAGEVAKAVELDEDTFARLTAVFGPDHPTTLVCATNLALDLAAVGRDEEASRRLEQAGARLRLVLGDDHPATTEATDRTRRANCDIDPMPL